MRLAAALYKVAEHGLRVGASGSSTGSAAWSVKSSAKPPWRKVLLKFFLSRSVVSKLTLSRD